MGSYEDDGSSGNVDLAPGLPRTNAIPPPVSLNRFRKARARAEAEAQGAANRVKFGRTKAEKAARDEAEAKAARELDGRRLKSTD